MQKLLFFSVMAALVGVGCGGPAPAVAEHAAAAVVKATAADLAQQRAMAGSYIVAFRTHASAERFVSFAAEHTAHFPALAAGFLTDARVKGIRFLAGLDLQTAAPTESDPAAPPYLTRLANSALSSGPHLASLAQVDFATPEDAGNLLDEWEQGGRIWFAEPNYISRLSTRDDQNLMKKYAEDYGKFDYWWLSSVNMAQALSAFGARDPADSPTDEDLQANRPIVAILDSGVDYEHPALKDHIWTNTDLNAANCKNDLHGCNTTVAKRGNLGDGDVWPFDTSGPGEPCTGKDPNCSHGTHVAGLVAADGTWKDIEGRAIAGACPICQIMILRIVGQVGKESGILDSSIIAAFKYVTLFRHQGSPAVRVINASFGKFVRSRAVGLLVRHMRDQGALLVGAAGNEDTLSQEYPAAFNDAIAVAAVDEHFRKVSFSNFGRWVDIAAPGSQILSTVPGNGSDFKSGTSMAAPLVTAVAGLLVARYPNIGFADLRRAVLEGADPTLYRSDFEDGFNYNYYYPKIPQESARQPLLGNGLLNADAAVNRTTTSGLPLYTDLDRVKPGCGTVGSQGRSLLLLTLLPLVSGLWLALRLEKSKAHNGRQRKEE